MEATKFDDKINYFKKVKIMYIVLRLRFKSENHNVFTEEINKIALRLNDDIRIQSIDLIDKYVYGTSKDLVSEKEDIKYNNIIKLYEND